MRPSGILVAAIAFMLGALGPLGARAEDVDLLLVLAADVSRSIDEDEFDLQRKGYAAAMTDPRVLRAVAGGRRHAIAVCFVEWAGPSEQHIVVDWTVVRDEEGADGVAATMLSAPRSYIGRTSISEAIDFAMQRLGAAPASADKRVIDISGDGASNAGRPVVEARDEAVAAGVTINGLAIINTHTSPGYSMHTQPPGGLPKYYEDNVIGGPGAFLMQVENFETFSEALTRKLVAEIVRRRGTPLDGAVAGRDIARMSGSLRIATTTTTPIGVAGDRAR